MKLLKNQPYIYLLYNRSITSKKYSSVPSLNMFDEYTFLKDRSFGEYFGFTDDKTLELCNKNVKLRFEELKTWYNLCLTYIRIKICILCIYLNINWKLYIKRTPSKSWKYFNLDNKVRLYLYICYLSFYKLNINPLY